MNTFFKKSKRIVAVCVLLFTGLSSAYSTPPTNDEIIRRVQNLNTVIDIRVNDLVTDQIVYLLDKRRKESEIILGRTAIYFPYIENALREKGLPDELKFIPVIESSLLPNVESHQGAAGIWQFMKGTAQLQGLTINKLVDERKDLIKSTDKALDYLKLLYNMYGDWTLTLAAYNCGSGTINRAIKKANGATNYWDIAKYLPRETQKYIPKFIAVSYLMNYYYLYDLQPVEPQDEFKFVVTANIYDRLEFSEISQKLEIDVDLLKMLNPKYRKGVIPAGNDNVYTLNLPLSKMKSFLQMYDSTTDLTEHTFFINHNYVGIIDNAFATGEMKFPALQSKFHVVRDNLKDSAFVRHVKLGLSSSTGKIVVHRLKRKESLADVADANSIPLEELIAINNIDVEKGLAPGSLIRLTR